MSFKTNVTMKDGRVFIDNIPYDIEKTSDNYKLYYNGVYTGVNYTNEFYYELCSIGGIDANEELYKILSKELHDFHKNQLSSSKK